MTKRAVVLGGGGTVGIAWETGVIAGLKECGIDLSHADLFVGTSAGSVAGTQLAAGVNALAVLAGQASHGPNRAFGGAPLPAADLAAIFERWNSVVEMTPDVAREIGAMALAVNTVPETAWVSAFDLLLGVPEWPEPRLLLTAVDVDSGEFIVWDRTSGVPIHAAVASSCTVPGLLPPVTINGRRYMDGGVRSGTNADLAAGYDKVVIIAPIGSGAAGIGAFARRQLEREAKALGAGGSAVFILHPDEEALTAFGPNLMDAGRALPALQAGWRQGAACAGEVAGIWD
jgi:NTE family protein